MSDSKTLLDKTKEKAAIVKETAIEIKDSIKEGLDKLIHSPNSSRRTSECSIEEGKLIKPPEKLGKGKYYLAPTGQLIKRSVDME